MKNKEEVDQVTTIYFCVKKRRLKYRTFKYSNNQNSQKKPLRNPKRHIFYNDKRLPVKLKEERSDLQERKKENGITRQIPKVTIKFILTTLTRRKRTKSRFSFLTVEKV